MARKTKEREELERLSADAQEVFLLIGNKERHSGFLGLTLEQIVEFISRQRGKVMSEKEKPAFVKSIHDALLELFNIGLASTEARNGETIIFLTDKGDKAFV